MFTNRVLYFILGIVAFVVVPVQLVTTFVLGTAVNLSFGLLLLPINLVWIVLFFPLLGLSCLCNKVPALRNVIGLFFIPWVVITNTFVALMPSMGELQGRAFKLMLCDAWPYSWEFWRFGARKLVLDSFSPDAVALKEVIRRISHSSLLMQKVVARIEVGLPLDPDL